MARLNINIGTTANDRTGDPLRTAFEKVNANFIELYTRTGDDLQIPVLAGNNKKVLTTNGTTLSWGSVIANTGFDNNTVYNFNGIVIDNSDLEHGATALISIPDNGEAVNPLLLQNNYGSAAVTVGTSPGNLKTWTFGTDGSLTLPGAFTYPNGSLQRNTAPVNCQGNASTVVYTVSGQYQHTIKLLIQVEGIEGLGSILDTQACEMIIAKSFRADDIAASVYGIVYTSVAPLATFTALWNALTNRIEVLCTTPGANGVNVKIFATEISTSD